MPSSKTPELASWRESLLGVPYSPCRRAIETRPLLNDRAESGDNSHIIHFAFSCLSSHLHWKLFWLPCLCSTCSWDTYWLTLLTRDLSTAVNPEIHLREPYIHKQWIWISISVTSASVFHFCPHLIHARYDIHVHAVLWSYIDKVQLSHSSESLAKETTAH